MVDNSGCKRRGVLAVFHFIQRIVAIHFGNLHAANAIFFNVANIAQYLTFITGFRHARGKSVVELR